MRAFYGKPWTFLKCCGLSKIEDSRTDKFLAKHEDRFLELIHGKLQEIALQVAGQVANKLKLGKAEDFRDLIEQLLADLDLTGMSELSENLTQELESLFKEAGIDGLTAAGIAKTSTMTKQLDVRALAWSKQRSAELVGRKVLADGSIVDNPNPIYTILETTRDLLRTSISEAVELGYGTQELTKAIQESYAFSDVRARMIARTELANAMVEGNVAAWEASGLVTKKRSLLGNNENHGDDDIMNAAQGWIPFEEEFQSGHKQPPYHPNCVCDLEPGMEDDAEKVSLSRMLKK